MVERENRHETEARRKENQAETEREHGEVGGWAAGVAGRRGATHQLRALLASERRRVVRLVPLAERLGVDRHDAVLDERLRAHQLVAARVVHHVDDARPPRLGCSDTRGGYSDGYTGRSQGGTAMCTTRASTTRAAGTTDGQRVRRCVQHTRTASTAMSTTRAAGTTGTPDGRRVRRCVQQRAYYTHRGYNNVYTIHSRYNKCVQDTHSHKGYNKCVHNMHRGYNNVYNTRSTTVTPKA